MFLISRVSIRGNYTLIDLFGIKTSPNTLLPCWEMKILFLFFCSSLSALRVHQSSKLWGWKAPDGWYIYFFCTADIFKINILSPTERMQNLDFISTTGMINSQFVSKAGTRGTGVEKDRDLAHKELLVWWSWEWGYIKANVTTRSVTPWDMTHAHSPTALTLNSDPCRTITPSQTVMCPWLLLRMYFPPACARFCSHL